ncbi:nickel-dependent lactate racemase [Tyzzerella sp. OttesenSCG-928-J15]|nr:nickel-dependent lactate racemase [Tyzzerella sp. OttesenSCG-928-J15]
MEINISCGKDVQLVKVDKNNIQNILLPAKPDVIGLEGEIIAERLKNPIGTGLLSSIVSENDKVAIIVSDITRPVPSYKILPYVLAEINKCGIARENITIVFALGSHRRHTKEEQIKLVGEEIFNSYNCVDSDPDDCIHMGMTKAGTPVDITKVVAHATKRICIGNIEYHYFAGYSGGAKAIMPGCSTKAAIQTNHGKMTEKNARAAVVNGNPVRDDLEEAINYCPIDFIVNVILDENKNIVDAVCGHFIKAHREGCKLLDKLYAVEIEATADIVIVSQGGYPKDINLYQLQKALDNAKNAVKQGGTIILVGACNEGFGESLFEEWMLNGDSPRSIIERIEKDFKLGAHKAAAIAMVMEMADIYLVSQMDKEIVEKINMVHFESVQAAFDKAMEKHGENASVIIMPYGGSTLPIVV